MYAFLFVFNSVNSIISPIFFDSFFPSSLHFKKEYKAHVVPPSLFFSSPFNIIILLFLLAFSIIYCP
ncbi:MAG: hypothetical protein BYD32DRAFT_404652 [Podila humilis]|nr:MAG: hypothetical protein BYD32DRAFT_404652 [Podila humilis]